MNWIKDRIFYIFLVGLVILGLVHLFFDTYLERVNNIILWITALIIFYYTWETGALRRETQKQGQYETMPVLRVQWYSYEGRLEEKQDESKKIFVIVNNGKGVAIEVNVKKVV